MSRRTLQPDAATRLPAKDREALRFALQNARRSPAGAYAIIRDVAKRNFGAKRRQEHIMKALLTVSKEMKGGTE